MAEDAVGVEGLARLRSAAHDFARAEIGRISEAVIEDLRSRPAEGVFSEVGARHLWDEYSWSLQEGPFDDDLALGDVPLGSLSGAFDGIVCSSIAAEVEKLPQTRPDFSERARHRRRRGERRPRVVGRRLARRRRQHGHGFGERNRLSAQSRPHRP